MTPRETLAKAREQSADERALDDIRHRKFMREFEQQRATFERQALPHLRRATAADYSRWLRGYVARGGHIGHCYDYPTPDDRWYVATGPFTLEPMFGAGSVMIIVPEGIAVEVDEKAFTHNQVFWMDSYRVSNTSGAPAFSDTVLD